jgi:NAD(P)-dependent dehydrogenase (short-subunit alcohol dehydrogenase family)
MSQADGGKAIFITGAASGIGRETARLFAAEGQFIGTVEVNAPGLSFLEAEIGAGGAT